jgi:hypothetical protein
MAAAEFVVCGQEGAGAMGISKPFRRVCRQFVDGRYSEGGRWLYLLHPKFAIDPRHYVRAFLLIQQDVQELFSYVEPSDPNLATYSHRIQQLLMRACVEVEANFTAIFLDNEYALPNGSEFKMQHYRLIEKSHRLSSFEVRIPGWKGVRAVRRPFEAWATGESLAWYRAYNKSKHNRHENFHLATLDAMVDAYCGLNVLLSAQFHTEDYSSGHVLMSAGGGPYTYEGNDGMEPAIGDVLRIRFPSDWPTAERYDFDWQQISSEEDPFQNFDFAALARPA